jgi:hypothetical protein
VPAAARAAIAAAFHSAGAAYGKKKRRCVLRMPRHQAENTISPDIGNRRRIRTTARARVSPARPGASTVVTAGANAIPTSARPPAATSSRPATAPARARAAALSARSFRAAYTGMKDAERVPSPSRLRIALGMRSATRTASAAAPLPR